jgi:predicted patatin/cPLA2 family phospholipase
MHPLTIDEIRGDTMLAGDTLGGYLRELADEPEHRERPALVVQGGGLRGIYSLSALAVLEELGLRDAFSRVVGSSAGAINGAYFLAGQAGESISIYSEDLSNREFFNPWRLRKRVDVDYMIETLKRRHPLKIDAMLAAPATLYTVLTDAETAEAHVVSNRDPRFDVYEVFRATAALPGLYNERVPLGDRRYVDGGVSGLVPLKHAFAPDPLTPDPAGEEEGPSEAIVLLTRGNGHRRVEQSPIFRAVVHAALAHGQSAPVRKKVCTEDAIYNEAMDELEEEAKRIPRRTWTVRPTDPSRLVNRTTISRDRLLDTAELARADTLAFLAQDRHALAPRAAARA